MVIKPLNERKILSMFKKMKKANGGFTLVELVVILVILAILAAMLVPTLTGYIDKAREKVVIAEARSVYIALQSEIGEAYAKDGFDEGSSDDVPPLISTADVETLAEVSEDSITSFSWDDSGAITGIVYKNSYYTATYDENGAWTYTRLTQNNN